jgi:hypothetical protein
MSFGSLSHISLKHGCMKCNKLEISCRDLKGSRIITQRWVKDQAEEMLHEPKNCNRSQNFPLVIERSRRRFLVSLGTGSEILRFLASPHAALGASIHRNDSQ